MTTYLGKSCSFCLPRVPFVNCRQFMYLVISLLVLRAGYGIWLYQFLIIAYLFTLDGEQSKALKSINDQPLDTAWVSPAARERAGLKKTMTELRDELVNNLAKLSEVDKRKSEVENTWPGSIKTWPRRVTLKFSKRNEIELRNLSKSSQT